MNITIFIGGLSGGGAERVVCNLSNYLAKCGHKVEILTMAEDKPAYGLDCSVTRFSLMNSTENLGKIQGVFVRIKRLISYLKKKNTDCYLVFLPVTIILLLLFKRLIKAPIIASERANPESYSKYIKYLLKKLAKRTEGFVFQTNDAMDWYKDCTPRTIKEVIPNAINEEFIGKKYEGERKKVIVGAGRMNAQKNFGLLIRSFANVANDFPEYNLKIFGQGSLLDEHKNLAESLGIGDRVEFPGYVSNIGEQIKDASLFVLSSDYEGMPNALMEAMALGLPCVSTNCPCGGPEFLIDDGKNGLLVNVNDEKMITDAIKKVLSDEEMSKKLGENASKICETLAPEKIYGQWEEFILSVINGGNL